MQVPYSRFVHGLSRENIQVNRKARPSTPWLLEIALDFPDGAMNVL